MLAAATTLGAALALGVEWGCPPSLGVGIAFVGTAVGVAGVLAGRRWRAPTVVLGLLVGLTGIGLARGASAAPARTTVPPTVDAFVVEGTVVDVTGHRGSETLVAVSPERASTAGLPGNLLVVVPGRVDLLPGDRVRVEASGLRLPGTRRGPTSEPRLVAEGIGAIAVSPRLTVLAAGSPSPHRLLAEARRALATAVAGTVPPSEGTLVDALALGIKDPLPSDLAAAYQDSGLVHLLATSGLKVAVVLALIAGVLEAVACPPRLRLGVLVTSTAAYVALTGASPAAVRAAAMATVGLGTAGTSRHRDPIPLLAVVGTTMLLVDPPLATDVGYQLSVLGTLGILLFARPIHRWLPGPRFLGEPVAVTIAAQLLTFPVTAATFGSVSLVAPLANAVALPLLPPLLVAGWLGAALAALAPPLGWLPLQSAGLLAEAIGAIARGSAAIPLAALHPGPWTGWWTLSMVLAALVGVALAAGRRQGTGASAEALDLGPDPLLPARESPGASSAPPRGPRGALPGALPTVPAEALRGRGGLGVAACAGALLVGGVALLDIVALASHADGRLHVTVLDVGAAPAVVVRTPAGGVALVDGGAVPDRLLRALTDVLPFAERTIDLLVLTGGERAATAGLAALAEHYTVRRVLLPRGGLGATTLALVSGLRDRGATVLVDGGRPWSWSDARWHCLPIPGVDVDSPPGPACVLRVAAESGSALILGDAPTSIQEELSNDVEPTDLLVAPPGGAVATSLALAARPRQIAVPSVRPPRSTASGPGLSVRATAVDGSLEYVGGPRGMEPRR